MTEKELKRTLINFLDAGAKVVSDNTDFFKEKKKEYLPDSIEYNKLSKYIESSNILETTLMCWICELAKRWSEEDD